MGGGRVFGVEVDIDHRNAASDVGGDVGGDVGAGMEINIVDDEYLEIDV